MMWIFFIISQQYKPTFITRLTSSASRNTGVPTIIHYRKFKDFNNGSFIKDLQTLLTKSFNEEAIPFQALRESVNVTLEKHAPTKKRYARANQEPS